MGYVEENLMPGETVLYKGRFHWFALVVPGAVSVAGAVIISLSYVSSGPIWAWFGIFGSLVLLAGAIATMSRFIGMRSAELALTSRRVILKDGFVRRRTRELFLDKLETIGVDQGAIARMFGFGKLTIIGTGGTREPVANVADPQEFRRHVLIELAK